MKKIAAIIILLFVGMTVAHAGGFLLLHVGSSDGNGGVVPACSNQLDFSQACNSQYLL